MTKNNKEWKKQVDQCFKKPNDYIKNIIGDELFSILREFAADILDETERKVRFNRELVLPILSYALGSAFYVMRTTPEEQNKWFDLATLVYQSSEELLKNHLKNEAHQPSSIFSGLKKDKIDN